MQITVLGNCFLLNRWIDGGTQKRSLDYVVLTAHNVAFKEKNNDDTGLRTI